MVARRCRVMESTIRHVAASRAGDDEIRTPPVPALIRPIARLLANGVKTKFLDPQIRDLLAFWESECGEHAWLAGEAFSAADIQMSFPLLALEGQGRLGDYPRLTDLLSRMRERQAYQRAVAKGGEFSMSE